MNRQVIGGLAFSLILGASSYGLPRNAGTPPSRNDRQITIRIHNYTQVKSSLLFQAERAASTILLEAGVNPVWVVCFDSQTQSRDAACASPVPPLDLILNLLPRSMAQRLSSRDETFGVAMESTEKGFGFYASVFYDNARDYAARQHLDLVPLLGHVLAHELGHLLLGTDSHSSRGLMCALWSGKEILAADQRRLSFTASETQRLQVAMLARWQAARSSAENVASLRTEGRRAEKVVQEAPMGFKDERKFESQ